MFRRPSDGIWAGLFVGIVAVTLLMRFHVDINGPKTSAPRAVVTSDKAARQFARAWQKMVYGSWSVDSTYTRVSASGQTYDVAVKDVQAPPNYLDESPTATTGSIAGRLYTCASVDQGKVNGCHDYGEAPPFSAYAQNRVVAVEQAVVGADAIYSVESQANDCYQLFLNAGKKANNWGNKARFCFDPKTGGPTFTQIDKDVGSDTVQAVKIGIPTPTDLVIGSLAP